MTTLFGWFDSWRTFAYMVIPLLVVATGAVPILAPGMVFVPFFLATLAIQFVALRLLARVTTRRSLRPVQVYGPATCPRRWRSSCPAATCGSCHAEGTGV